MNISFGYPGFWAKYLPRPSSSHWWMRIEVYWGSEGYRCSLTPSESQPQTSFCTTLGGYLLPWYPCSFPNPLPVACCLAISFSSPPEYRLHISSKAPQPTAACFIQHYRNSPTEAGSRTIPNHLPLPSCHGVVHLDVDQNHYAPGYWTDVFFIRPATHTFFHLLNTL